MEHILQAARHSKTAKLTLQYSVSEKILSIDSFLKYNTDVSNYMMIINKKHPNNKSNSL